MFAWSADFAWPVGFAGSAYSAHRGPVTGPVSRAARAGAACLRAGTLAVAVMLSGGVSPASGQAQATSSCSSAPADAPLPLVGPGADRAYAGLALRDDPRFDAPVVSYIFPGPLEGEGVRSPRIDRGDLLLAVNDEPVTAEGFAERVRASKPGDSLLLRIQRTAGEKDGATPQPGEQRTVEQVLLVLGSQAAWTGPISVAHPQAEAFDPDAWLAPDARSEKFEARLRALLREHELTEPYDRLTSLHATTLKESFGRHMLRHVAYGFRRPHRLGQLQRSVTGPLADVPAEPRRVLVHLARLNDVDRAGFASPPDRVDLRDPAGAVDTLATLLSRADERVDRAFAALELERPASKADETNTTQRASPRPASGAAGSAAAPKGAGSLDMSDNSDPPAHAASSDSGDPPPPQNAGAAPGRDAAATHESDGDVETASSAAPPQFSRPVAAAALRRAALAGLVARLAGEPDVSRHLRAIRLSLAVDRAALFDAAASLTPLLTRSEVPGHADTPRFEEAVPGVQGEVLAARRTSAGWIVYGGPDGNMYDMSKLRAVVDPGGDDAYRFNETDSGTHVVIDMAGADRYDGPAASGVLGVGLVVDYAGDDVYDAGEGGFAQGAGLLGVGLLLDYGGVDRFAAGRWSQGAGVYGAGAILNLGGQNDHYDAGAGAQGVGGPGGVGLLLDVGGNDRYRLGRLVPSAYGTKGQWYTMGQGVGFGFRSYDTGGVGALVDLEGDDRYEAGEFCQGGGYFWGLGVLHDRRGDDRYDGYRYAQGFGCHQAIGILADDEGDDNYRAGLVAHHGMGWDIASGYFRDGGGDDEYRGKSLGLGAASMQALAWCFDHGGADQYLVPGRRTLGQSGSNRYHFARTGAASFSLFADLGAGEDRFPETRQPQTVRVTDAPNEKNPSAGLIHGLFVDSPAWPVGPQRDTPTRTTGAATADP